MDIDHILIKDCYYCGLFLDPNRYLNSKLYFKDNSRIENSDFIIVESQIHNVPMVVVRDHVTDISKELWGRILYRFHLDYGFKAKIQIDTSKQCEHWHGYLVRG